MMSSARPAPVDPEHSTRWSLAAWVAALIAAILPLWVARDLPLVDLPQHFYLLDVSRRIHDATTLYSNYFDFHLRFTPYLGYYGFLSALAAGMPLELANRIFLSMVVIALPLSTAFLLDALGRQRWPALLVVPIAYGDSFCWGFVNTCAAIPIALFALGAFIHGLADPASRARWAWVAGIALLGGFFMHPVPSGFLALALPAMLLTTRAPSEARNMRAWLRARLPLIVAVLPALTMAAIWLVLGSKNPVAIRPGVPGFAWGPMLSRENLQWEPPLVNLEEFTGLLANMFNNDADSLGLAVAAAVAVLAVGSRLIERGAAPLGTALERARPGVLVGIAFGLYVLLPLNIQGVIQYLNPRFAPLTGALLASLVPRTGRVSSRVLLATSVIAVFIACGFLAAGIRVFDSEAAAVRRLLPAVANQPRIMGLIFEPRSRIVHHPVYLHAAATLARLKGGIPNFTFADGRQMPLRYRVPRPAAPISEWRADLFDYATMGAAYDHFLLRGASPESVFAGRLGRELRVVAQEDDWWLIRREP